VVSLIGHGVAMADFGGGIPDHRHNKAVANRISHGGVVTNIRDIQNIEKIVAAAAPKLEVAVCG